MSTQTYPVPPPELTQLADSSGTIINPATEDTLLTLLGVTGKNIRDPDNSRDTPLAANENFVGEWIDLESIPTFIILYFATTPFASVNLQFSADGVNLVPDPLLGTIPLSISNGSDGFYTASTNLNVMLYRYARINVTNGPTAQSFFGSHFWLLKEPYSGSYGNLTDALGAVSSALLTRSVVAGNVVDGLGAPTGAFENAKLSPSGALNIAQPNVEIFRYATPDDPEIPTGPPVTIHPILNTEPNTVDTGWFPSTLYPGGSRVLVRTGFGGGTVKAYIANASDEFGNNAEGLLFALTDTAFGSPQVNGADFFDRYSRIILVNDSGTDTAGVTARITGAQVPQPGVTSSISSQLFDFFPATLNKSALFGKIPNSPLLKALEITTNGFLTTTNEPFEREVSLGRVFGHSIAEIQGQSDAVPTTFEDIWFITGGLAEPTTAGTISISSTSVLDTSGGTGIREVLIEGLDVNYEPIEELITLNGLTPVVTINQYLRVFSMRSTDNGSLEVSAGIITGIHGGTLLPIVRMKTGVLNSAKSHYTIPAGKVGILVEEEVNAGVDDDADFRLQVREFGTTAYRTTRLQSVSGGAVSRIVTATENIFPAKSDIRWQARKIGIGTTRATVNYSLMLIDEDLV